MVDQATTSTGDRDEQPTTSGKQPIESQLNEERPGTPSAESSKTAMVSQDNLRRLAEKTSL